MTKPQQYKKHHYVPVTYLKRWTNPQKWEEDTQKIYALNWNDKKIRFVETKSQCQKNNLYTTPADFKTQDRKVIEKAFMGHNDEVYSKAMSKSYDVGKDPDDVTLNGVLLFTIYQSFRTPKFRCATIKKIKNLKDKFTFLKNTPEEFTFNLVYLLVKIAPDIHKNCILEILVTKPGYWFLTSDNPASYWLYQWNKFTFLDTILGFNESNNIKLLCPINPQICFIVHLNLNKIRPCKLNTQSITPTIVERTILRNELLLINKSIIDSSDKQIFSIDPKQLEYYKK